jgi:23S rRNA (adenine2503-C2)-methyltransferase
MACSFCYTGKMGLLSSLSTEHIVGQFILARRYLRDVGDPTPLRHAVLMGQGEPMDNLDAVLPALKVLTGNYDGAQGLGMSPHHVTVSTVGLVPEMGIFMESTRGRHTLAVSIHAGTEVTRRVIVPTSQRYRLDDICSFLATHFPRAGKSKKNFCVIEYTMLRGVNDSAEEAVALAARLRPIWCVVNLIVYNTHIGASFQASLPETVTAFVGVLRGEGLKVTVRESRGDDAMAACGQLGDLAMAAEKRKRKIGDGDGGGDVDDSQKAEVVEVVETTNT